MKILIAVTHLHGSGHLIRSLLIAEEFIARGHQVVVASGGFPLAHIVVEPQIEFVQLPPVRSNGTDFSRLLTPDGVATPDYLADRAQKLVAVFDKAAPDCVITEQYPFGRGSLRTEFQALIDRANAATHKPLILASIRDVLEPPSTGAKEARALNALQAGYDSVLVHGDARFIPLEKTWPSAARIDIPIHHTGYIAPKVQPEKLRLSTLEQDNILVSAGGGPLGASLFEAAMDCAVSGAFADKTWRFVIGGADREKIMQDLRARAPKNVIVEPVRPDFFALYRAAHVTLMRVGYNAFLDLCRARTPTVLCPFDGGSETEQSTRASALQERLGLPVLTGDDLTADNLAKAMENAIASPKMPPDFVTMEGQARTVDHVLRLSAERAAKG